MVLEEDGILIPTLEVFLKIEGLLLITDDIRNVSRAVACNRNILSQLLESLSVIEGGGRSRGRTGSG